MARQLDIGIRFGKTVITVDSGDLFTQDVDGIVLASNTRGTLGGSGTRLAGHLADSQIERDLRAQGPLRLGSAWLTSGESLLPVPMQHIAHTIISKEPGGNVREADLLEAIDAALILLEETRVRSIAIPLMGVSNTTDDVQRFRLAASTVERVVRHLRTRSSRMTSIVLVTRFDDDIPMVEAELTRVRQVAWRSTG